MSSKDETKTVEAEEVIAADAKKEAVKGTKRPADVSFIRFFQVVLGFATCKIHARTRVEKNRHFSTTTSLEGDARPAFPPLFYLRPLKIRANEKRELCRTAVECASLLLS